ncbi:YcaO-like family protein [Streptomyces sp. NPDC002911]
MPSPTRSRRTGKPLCGPSGQPDEPNPRPPFFQITSSGLASGNNMAEAVHAALLETIERLGATAARLPVGADRQLRSGHAPGSHASASAA